MTIAWSKLGLVYCASADSEWAYSHAYCPTPVARDEDTIRVFCAFLDEAGIGRCGFVDVDARDPTRVLAISERPALDVGAAGTFDEHGVTPLCALRLADGSLRLYYAGWQRGVGVRYFLFTGVAHSRDGGARFVRHSQAPVLDRSDHELHIRTGGLVLPRGEGYEMWYAGGSGWVSDGTTLRPRYELRHATSADGLSWPAVGEVSFEPAEDELGFGRPCILQRDGKLHMWYGRRSMSGAYQLGYAVSVDGSSWERRDGEAGLGLGAPGAFDSEMVGLAGLIETEHGTYLFYNGNGYGRTGFGVAVAR